MGRYAPNRLLTVALWTTLALTPHRACGSISFTSGAVYDGPAQPISMPVADLNRDGLLDLVVAGDYASEVWIYLGMGNGQFEPPRRYGVGSQTNAAITADLDGDGFLDIATANSDGGSPDFYYGSVSLLFGDGNGGFPTRVDITISIERPVNAVLSLCQSDFNDDGHPDLALGTGGGLTVLLNDGTAHFTQQYYETGQNIWTIASSDLDRDGRQDLVFHDSSNGIETRLGNGDGTFQYPHSYYIGSQGIPSLAVADLNEDGIPDVVYAPGFRFSGDVTVFLGNGDGSLRLADSPYYYALGAVRPVLADLNGDLHLDLTTPRPNGSGLTSLFEGDGHGSFQDAGTVTVNASVVAAGDFDGDGRADLACGVFGLSPQLQILRNVTDFPLRLNAPATADGAEGERLTFALTVGGADDGLISVLSASGLPPGATFTAAPNKLSGQFDWMPDFGQAGSYAVQFHVDDGAGQTATAATLVTIRHINRPPIADAGPARGGIVNVGVSFDGSSSSDPDGDPLTFSWSFGDGNAGSGANPVHTFTATGTYTVALRVSDPVGLYGDDTTTATIALLQVVDVFAVGGNRTIRLGSSKATTCLQIEPVSFNIGDMDLSSTRMTFANASIPAISGKTSANSDKDHDGVMEIAACFSKDDLRALFSAQPSGEYVVVVGGQLVLGGVFQGEVTLQVVANGGALSASVSPNPFNPQGTLTFVTSREGYVKVRLFDMRGRLVRTVMNESKAAAGYHDLTIDGRDARGNALASGVYYLTIQSSVDGNATTAVTILK